LAQAQLAIGRAKVAVARGELLAAQADVKAGEGEVGVARADVARLKTLLAYTRIKAPFDGVIARRQVDHGTFVRSAALGSGAPLLIIEKTDRLRLVVDIPESDAPLVRPASSAQVQIRALGDAIMN